MTLFGVRRPTERASVQQRKEAKYGPGRRLPDKPDKPEEHDLCGWNLPAFPDDNDVVVWMTREMNGDNKRKQINEVYEEEQYRHITGHCAAIENKLLFDRQSLNDRFLENYQYGVRDTRANKVSPVGPLPVSRSCTRPPAQHVMNRNCYSANAMKDEDEEEGKEGVEGVGVMRELSHRRSQSAVCCSASMRTVGMTSLDSRQAVDSRKNEWEDAAWDEGYGSKVSSNEHIGTEEAGSTKTRSDCIGEAAGDSGISPAAATPSKMGPVLNTFPAQPFSHQDAMARLMYSRRERTVYERFPSQRMRGKSFRYAGREQSRLTEASLGHINPAYLARDRHLSDLASITAQASQVQGDKCPPSSSPQLMVENGYGEEKGRGLQPRTMVLRKITIQDSGKEVFSQNINSTLDNAAGVLGAGHGPSPERMYQRQGLVSTPVRTPSGRVISDSVLRPGVSVRVQDLSTDPTRTSTRISPAPTVTKITLPDTCNVKSIMSMPSENRQAGGSSTLISPVSWTSPASDRLATMSSFAITDLLPAVEKNLRSQLTSLRGLNKTNAMGITTPFASSIANQQQQARIRQRSKNHQAMMVSMSQSNGSEAIAEKMRSSGVEGTAAGKEDGLQRPQALSNGKTLELAGSSAADDVRSFAGFRPHHQTTPLQRAKEIASRRMHGHVQQMPEGLETVPGPSPLYASRADQSSHRRSKSASRLLGHVMSRYKGVNRNSAA